MHYPFAAIVGQAELKLALLANAICPALGGVLISGAKGTAKSTAARALADLLPEIEVIPHSPWNSAPDDPPGQAPGWESTDTSTVVRTHVPFIELPLGATEDRVTGSLDFHRILQTGERTFQPGVLAAANRGVLYVDEVNLLPDHLVDLLLDAAASGRNTVQREGIEVAHPARFLLVGTMNREEGPLRPQLLDRFGLMVEVDSPTDSAVRLEIVRRRIAFDESPEQFLTDWNNEQDLLRERIIQAKALFSQVSIPEPVLHSIIDTCARAGVEGLRADLVLHRLVRVLAAWDGRTTSSLDDVALGAPFVLRHRRQTPPNSASPKPQQPQLQPQQPQPSTSQSTSSAQRSPASDPASGFSAQAESPQEEPSSDGESELPQENGGETVLIPAPVHPLQPIRIEITDDNIIPGRGKRASFPQAPQGRAVRTIRDPKPGDLAFGATLRSAMGNGQSVPGKISVQPDDLHRYERADQTSVLILFVVDASGSMAARQRMEAVKGAALSLLAEADRKRDQIGIISFRGTRAELLLSPGKNIEQARESLRQLPTGGRTPLAGALQLAHEMVRKSATSPRRSPVLLVILTDGKANVPLPGTDGDPWLQSMECGRELANGDAVALVVDTETDFIRHDRARLLADTLRAEYLSLAQLDAESLTLTIRQQTAGRLQRSCTT